MILGVSGKSGMIILLINWVLAYAGVISEMTGKKPFKHFSLCLYLLMGWLCVCIMPQMYKVMSMQSLIWLASGGVVYTLGVIFYVSKREFSHAIWHLFVLGGAAGHWISVLLLCR